MNRQFAVIGLGSFGRRMTEELAELGSELLIVDKDRATVDHYKFMASASFCVDVINQRTVERIIPKSIDVAIVDLGKPLETSILVTSYLRKIGIRDIIVKAESDEHAEILKLVGAHRTVFPDREAAKRITPQLLSSALLNFLPVSHGLVIAEVRTPKIIIGKTLRQADVRKKYGVNIIGVRKGAPDADHEAVTIDYIFSPEDIVLLAGKEQNVADFSGIASGTAGKRTLKTLLKRIASTTNSH